MSSATVVPEPYDEAMLDVGDGHQIHWTVRGNPDGTPALLLHGGPGSGATRGPRRLFDPARYRIIEFDQRNCGASTPHASQPQIDLSTNTTAHLIADIEQLRQLLGIERWLVWGGSWGTTLGLAYAEAHPAARRGVVTRWHRRLHGPRSPRHQRSGRGGRRIRRGDTELRAVHRRT